MREIKFRAISNSRWVYGHYTQGSHECHYITKPDGSVWQIDPESLGEFTGLSDKDGVEIYEGDIVKCYLDGEPMGALDEIIFKKGAFILRARTVTLHQWDSMPHDTYTGELEVIGNVHLDPELL